MGCFSSKLHPARSESCNSIDEKSDNRQKSQSDFHDEFTAFACQMDDSVDTFVKSLSFRSRSSLCESIETNSGSTDLVKQSNRSHTTCKMHHGVENGSADDHSDLHDWLLELEETICTNPNKEQQLATHTQDQKRFPASIHAKDEFESLHKSIAVIKTPNTEIGHEGINFVELYHTEKYSTQITLHTTPMMFDVTPNQMHKLEESVHDKDTSQELVDKSKEGPWNKILIKATMEPESRSSSSHTIQGPSPDLESRESSSVTDLIYETPNSLDESWRMSKTVDNGDHIDIPDELNLTEDESFATN